MLQAKSQLWQKLILSQVFFYLFAILFFYQEHYLFKASNWSFCYYFNPGEILSYFAISLVAVGFIGVFCKKLRNYWCLLFPVLLFVCMSALLAGLAMVFFVRSLSCS